MHSILFLLLRLYSNANLFSSHSLEDRGWNCKLDHLSWGQERFLIPAKLLAAFGYNQIALAEHTVNTHQYIKLFVQILWSEHMRNSIGKPSCNFEYIWLGILGYLAFDNCGRDLKIFYKGTSEPDNLIYTNWNCGHKVYYYRITAPTTSGNYWHYVNETPTIW